MNTKWKSTAVSNDCLREMKSLLLAAFNTLCILGSSLNYSLKLVFINYKQVGQSCTQVPMIFEIPGLPPVIFGRL